MSWSESLFDRRLRSRVLASVLLAGVAADLGGCATPLYASRGGALGADLKAIAVDPVPDRLGHYLRDDLLTNLNGTGSRPAPRYRLQLTTAERVQTALIDITTQRAQNASVVTDVTWKLLPMDGSTPIATGKTTSFATYDRSAQRYANIRAAQDAEIRDARALADQLTTQIAATLASQPAP